MKYVVFNSDGRINGFYSDDIHDNIPTGSIKISDEVWQSLLSNTQDFKIKDSIDNTLEYAVLDNLVSIVPIIQYVDDMPTQDEIDFAEYVLAVDDRLTQLETTVNGGV